MEKKIKDLKGQSALTKSNFDNDNYNEKTYGNNLRGNGNGNGNGNETLEFKSNESKVVSQSGDYKKAGIGVDGKGKGNDRGKGEDEKRGGNRNTSNENQKKSTESSEFSKNKQKSFSTLFDSSVNLSSSESLHTNNLFAFHSSDEDIDEEKIENEEKEGMKIYFNEKIQFLKNRSDWMKTELRKRNRELKKGNEDYRKYKKNHSNLPNVNKKYQFALRKLKSKIDENLLLKQDLRDLKQLYKEQIENLIDGITTAAETDYEK